MTNSIENVALRYNDFDYPNEFLQVLSLKHTRIQFCLERVKYGEYKSVSHRSSKLFRKH